MSFRRDCFRAFRAALLASTLPALARAQEPPAEPPKPVTPQEKPVENPPPKVEPLPEGQQQKLQALVIAVEGRVEWKNAADKQFKAAAVNDLLDPGCEIRTGLRSSLTLRVGKNATLLVARSSRIELPVIVQDGAVLRTRAAVHRGKCDFKVEAVGVVSDFQVLTPSATLAVRGTGFSVEWGALDGLAVRGVDTNKLRALEVAYFGDGDTVSLSGAGRTTSTHHDPVKAALFRTIFPPPHPGLMVGDIGQPPFHRPPPFIHHFKQQQKIDQGGSDIGTDVGPGQSPPSHG